MSLSNDGILLSQLNLLPNTDLINWKNIIHNELYRNKERYDELDNILKIKYDQDKVNPAKENIFRAFKECPFEKTVVVCCGQDPYPNKIHATGLAFSIPNGCSMPPTLKNILKELKDDIGYSESVEGGDLSSWAQQGVLLLNTALTVETGVTNSHKNLWGDFSAQIMRQLNREKSTPLVFILWGNNAKNIGKVLEKEVPVNVKRLFLYSPHPSPLSSYRGFFGSKPFSKINDFLSKNNLQTIRW